MGFAAGTGLWFHMYRHDTARFTGYLTTSLEEAKFIEE